MKDPKQTLSGNAPEAGLEDASAPAAVDPSSGQHKDHWVLPDAERAKGFVRPMRLTYTHVGPKPPGNLVDLTPAERERHSGQAYVKFEPYPEEHALAGMYWTQERLDSLGGCKQATTMPRKIAETAARDPGFYGKTFCCGCNDYLPVAEFVWDDGSRMGS